MIHPRKKLPLEVHGQEERLSIADAEDCLLDALLLSACDAFIHADSWMDEAIHTDIFRDV
jgi:hypothetical protein